MGRDSTRIESVAVLGSGLSGCSVARSLLALGYTGEIHLFDRRTDFSREQRWCSWGPLPSGVPVSASWPGWRLRGSGRTVERSLPSRPYLHVHAPQFFEVALNELADAPNVSLHLGAEAHLEDGRIRCAGDPTAADITFDATGISGRSGSGTGVSLWQSFSGLVVCTERPVFTPETVTLMDFVEAPAEGLSFVYVLPFARDRALVESTTFSDVSVPERVHLARVGRYLERLGAGGFTEEARETGRVPMSTRRGDTPGNGVVPVGVAGGAARASSGYAIVTILRESDRIARSVSAGERPSPLRRPARQTVLDEVFLSVVGGDAAEARRAFLDLFERVPQGALIRFLSGDGTLRDEALVVASLRKTPFVKAALAAGLARTRGRFYRP